MVVKLSAYLHRNSMIIGLHLTVVSMLDVLSSLLLVQQLTNSISA